MEERADAMTDYQMRTLMNMVIAIVNDVEKKEDAVKKLKAIRDGKLDELMDEKEYSER